MIDYWPLLGIALDQHHLGTAGRRFSDFDASAQGLYALAHPQQAEVRMENGRARAAARPFSSTS